MSPNAEKSRKVEKAEKEEEKKKKNAIEKEIEKIDDPNQNGETQSTTPKKVLILYVYIFLNYWWSWFLHWYTELFSTVVSVPTFT